MAKTTKTHLFCFDDHRNFTEDVRKRFADTARYKVISFPTPQDLLKHLEEEKEHNFCKVAIIGVNDSKENYEAIEHLTIGIKKIDHNTGLILVGPSDKMEEIKKTVKFNIDAYVPKNVNAILRIHNTVKKLISEHSISIFRKRRNVSLYTLIAFLLISAILILVAFFRLPKYF